MNEEHLVVDLEHALTIADVADVYARILGILAEHETVKINISNLERVDTSGLQLLYNLALYGLNGGVQVIWSEISSAFDEAAGFIGLDTDIFMASSD